VATIRTITPAAEGGDAAEQPRDDHARDQDEREDADDRDRDARQHARQRRRISSRSEGGDEQHERNHREVLEERDPEEPPHERRSHLVAGGQDRKNDRRRSERDQDPVESGAARIGPERHPDQNDEQHRQPHLQRAGDECRLPERAELVERQVEADEKEDESDAELGDDLDLPGVADPAERVRSDHDAGHEVRDDLGHPEALAEKKQRKRRREDDRDVEEKAVLAHGVRSPLATLRVRSPLATFGG
jgi:hypothetical protein